MKAKAGVGRNRDTKENREFWDFLEGVIKEVSTWPEWKRGMYSCIHCGAPDLPHETDCQEFGK